MLKKFKYFTAVFRSEIVEVPVGLKDKTKVAEWLGKAKEMFTDKKQINDDLNITCKSKPFWTILTLLLVKLVTT